MKIPLLTAAALVLSYSAHASTTIIGNNGSGQNSGVPDSFGDNVSASDPGRFIVSDGGTPNIGLTWGTTQNIAGGSTRRWEFHNWTNAGGGALQLNGSEAAATGNADPFLRNDVHTITFTPGAGFAASVIGFDFIGDTNGDTYQYDWRIIDTSDDSVLASGQTSQWTTDTNLANNGAPSVAPNYTGAIGQALRLDFVQSAGSTGDDVNIAIDNLEFAQAVPEPATTALLSLGGLALILRRRK